MKINVLPPDVNKSDVEFSVVEDGISFGLAAIKGVGENAVAAIVAERETGGPFQNIFDLTERVDPRHLNKAALETLIKAGALDPFGPTRAQHLLVAERAVAGAVAKHKDKSRGQKSLFGDDAADSSAGTTPEISLPEVPPWSHREQLAYEKEVFGFYLTSHPLTEFADHIRQHATHATRDLVEIEDRAEVLLGGMISSIKKATTKKPTRNNNSRYVNFDLEDADGVVRCIMWPDEFARLGDLVKADEIVFVQGKVDRRSREPNLIVDKLLTLDQADKEFTRQLAIKFQRGVHAEQLMERVRDILARHPGKSEVLLVVDTADEQNPQRRLRYILSAGSQWRVSCNTELRRELTEALGEGHVTLHGMPKKKPNGNGRPRLRIAAG